MMTKLTVPIKIPDHEEPSCIKALREVARIVREFNKQNAKVREKPPGLPDNWRDMDNDAFVVHPQMRDGTIMFIGPPVTQPDGSKKLDPKRCGMITGLK